MRRLHPRRAKLPPFRTHSSLLECVDKFGLRPRLTMRDFVSPLSNWDDDKRMQYFRPKQSPSGSVVGQLQTAVAFHRAGNFNEAELGYKRILRLQPTNSEALRLLGSLFMAQGKLLEATESLRAALRAQPRSVEAHYGLGNILHAQNDLSGAVACYRQALKLRPKFPEALCNLGNVLAADGKWEEAADTYRTALKLQPSNPQLRENLKIATEQLDKSTPLTPSESAYAALTL